METRHPGTYRIELDKKWRFEEFAVLPHFYNQIYAFHYAFYDDEEQNVSTSLNHAFKAFPWIGGYSAVNFYRTLKIQVPKRLEPVVKAIKYASPGHIDLSLYVQAAQQIGAILTALAVPGGTIHLLYNNVRKEAIKRELLRIDVQRARQKLAQDDITFVIKASKDLAEGLNFEHVKELEELTENPLISLKILMSYYRRLTPLIKFQSTGKAKFPG